MKAPPKSPATLYGLGTRAFARGDAVRALAHFQALREHPRSTDVDRLDALSGLARSHYQLDDAELALECARALQHEGRRLGHADAEADALVFLGQIHLEYGADKLAERSLRVVVGPEGRAASAIFRANAWFMLGKIAFERSRYADCREALDHAARIYRRLGRMHGLADVEIVRGHLAHVTGALSRALACARRARLLFGRIGDPYGEAGAWHLEGEVLQTQRRPREAIRVLRLASAVYRRLRDPTNLASMLVQLGDVLVSIGEHADAEKELVGAIAILRALDKPHRLAPVLLALAHVRKSLGRIVEGLALEREATDLLVGVDADPVDTARAHEAQAQTLSLLGRRSEARALLERALVCLREFPVELETANTHLDLARLDESEGADPVGIAAHLDTARAIFRRRKIWHSLTQIDLVEARVLAVHGEFVRAARAAGHALRRAERTHDPQGIASARSLRAAMFARLGRVRAAEGEARLARASLERMDAAWNLASLEVDLASQYDEAGERAAAWSAACRALTSIEEIRADASASPSVHADLIEAFRAAQRVILSALRSREAPLALVERVERTRDVTRVMLRSKHGGARGEVRLVPPARVRRADVDALLAETLASATRGVVTLSWYPEVRPGERDLLLVTPSHGAWFCTLAEPHESVPSLLQSLLRDPGALTAEAWRELLDKLGDALLERPFVRAVPVSRADSRAPRTIAEALRDHQGCAFDVVPHGWTGLVPWAALPFRPVGRSAPERLVDHHLVRIRSRLPARAPRPETASLPRRALVFGDDGSSLPAARAEARTIAGLLRSAGVEVVEYGAERPLTVAALREEAARCDLLHLATHAEFNATSPWRSFARLSRGTADATGETLSLEALLDLRKAPREVVLSACSTVSIDRARLFDTFSLAHGFLHAGSSVVVGTLWNVDDAATGALMRRVYELRLAAGGSCDFSAAVRAAVREATAGRPRMTVASQGGTARGILGGAARRIVEPGSSPASWAALQVLVASGE